VECYWEKFTEEQKRIELPRVGEWRFMRKREDKTLPNADWVVRKIVDSLENEILESELREKSKVGIYVN
jgi:mRNA capping enzyme, C-terminal domain